MHHSNANRPYGTYQVMVVDNTGNPGGLCEAIGIDANVPAQASTREACFEDFPILFQMSRGYDQPYERTLISFGPTQVRSGSERNTTLSHLLVVQKDRHTGDWSASCPEGGPFDHLKVKDAANATECVQELQRQVADFKGPWPAPNAEASYYDPRTRRITGMEVADLDKTVEFFAKNPSATELPSPATLEQGL